MASHSVILGGKLILIGIVSALIVALGLGNPSLGWLLFIVAGLFSTFASARAVTTTMEHLIYENQGTES